VHEVADIAGAIVVVALVTTLVSHKGTAGVFRAGGHAFSESILAAQGKQ
jgi:cytochrome b